MVSVAQPVSYTLPLLPNGVEIMAPLSRDEADNYISSIEKKYENI